MPSPRLWTPIANAFDTYRRRVVIDPEAEYEHIWRLIHIQEALAVCLASLMATRLVDLLGADESTTIPDLREALTGLRSGNDGTDDDDATAQAPLRGSIGAWIELLNRFGRAASDDPFLGALSTYLVSTPNRPLAFAETWTRIAPVPSTFRDPGLDRVGRLRAINSFRNKLAHVPVPQRVLAELHRGLRVEVFDGLTDKFNPEADAERLEFIATSYRPPLTGVLYAGNAYVTGVNEVGVDKTHSQRDAAPGAAFGATTWGVEPFFRIDGEGKVALLFRVGDLQREPGATGYSGEYHRFAAELEPVTYVPISSEIVGPWIPRYSAKSIVKGDAELQQSPPVEESEGVLGSELPRAEHVEVLTPSELREAAEEAFQLREYPTAARFFDLLAETNDPRFYNDVARSKHGAAIWRVAERDKGDQANLTELHRAIALLQDAERHRDPRYSARSAYERSKALWHLWRATQDGRHLLTALDASERAVRLSPDEAFVGWLVRVKADVDKSLPQGSIKPVEAGA